MAVRRVTDEPAFVLHSYDWSESSKILEVFCRQQGRVAIVAKGAKKPTSNFRPVLLPLQPLRLTYGVAGEGASDIHTLKSADWVGGHVMPVGDALLSGLYLNELLLRLLARADPHPFLFDTYAGVVRVLANAQAAARAGQRALREPVPPSTAAHADGCPAAVPADLAPHPAADTARAAPAAPVAPATESLLEPVLRSFELLLLREIGLLPSLDAQTMTLEPLRPQARYALVAEGGLRRAAASDRATLPGSAWQALQRGLDSDATYTATLRACASVATELKPQLRALLQYHCGSPTLRTRQLMIDLQSL